MKRSESLTPLSHEHHHALFFAKRLRDDQGDGTVADFVEFWKKEGEIHFRIEEEVLLPGSGLEGPGSDDDVARMLDEHLDIRRRVQKVLEGQVSPEGLIELGTILTEHVRFEERQLFPRIEETLGEDGLAELGTRLEEAELRHQDGN
jgi:hemerythrin-like domain-containing protein